MEGRVGVISIYKKSAFLTYSLESSLEEVADEYNIRVDKDSYTLAIF